MDCKNARESLGLTQKAIGAYVSKNKSQIYKIESGRLKVPGSYLIFSQIVWRLSLEADFESEIKGYLISKLNAIQEEDRNFHTVEVLAITTCLVKSRFSVLQDVMGVKVSPDAMGRDVKGTSMNAALKSVEALVNNTVRDHAKSLKGKARESWNEVLMAGAQFIQKMRIAIDQEEIDQED